VCSLINRTLGCWAYLLMGINYGVYRYTNVWFIMMFYNIESISYICKLLIEALTYEFVIWQCCQMMFITPISTIMIFWLASFSEYNGLRVFQNASNFPTFSGCNYCNRHVLLFYLAKQPDFFAFDIDLTYLTWVTAVSLEEKRLLLPQLPAPPCLWVCATLHDSVVLF